MEFSMLCILVMHWHFGNFSYEFPRPALVMGIVNVTPDSFSDGGQFLDARAAVEQGLRLVEQGADILDIGGESTRPYSTSVQLNEEVQRVVPVVQTLAEQTAKIDRLITVNRQRIAAQPPGEARLRQARQEIGEAMFNIISNFPALIASGIISQRLLGKLLGKRALVFLMLHVLKH